jgi:RimJ/RimL family protein N-acetyltransferase
MEFVRNFMLLPEISRFAAEHGANKETAEFLSNERAAWFTYSVKGVSVGLIYIHVVTAPMCMIHPYILSAYKRHYLKMVKMFIKWFFDKMPDIASKINVAIPVTFPTAIKAAHKVGMTQEGIDRDSFLTSDGPVDRVLLGITRAEAQCLEL